MRKYLIGTGLVLIAVHNPNQPLIGYMFLPWVGIMLLVGAVVSIPFKDIKKAGLGSKWIWIPLLILSATITASGLAQYYRGEVTLARGLAPLCSTVIWIGLYLVARIEGDGIGKPIAVAVIIEAVSTTISAFVTGGVRNGGIVSPTNYDIATAVLVCGTFLSPRRWQWWLSGVAIVGLFFTGAEEGIVALGAGVLVFLMLRDWSLKTLIPVAALVICIAIATPLGITHNLYVGDKGPTYGENPTTLNKIQALELAYSNWKFGKWDNDNFNMYMDLATGYRWTTHWRIRPIQPFGYGYNLTEFYHGIPHNIVLIIIEQVGIIGLLSWLVVTIYCMKKSKRWYLWGTFLALGMFDHYFWTQWGPVWWVMVGISEAHNQETSNIFTMVDEPTKCEYCGLPVYDSPPNLPICEKCYVELWLEKYGIKEGANEIPG